MKHPFKTTASVLMFVLGIASQAAAADSAMDCYNSAVDKQGKGDMDGAIADYNRVITLDPGSALASNANGDLRLIRGDRDGAIAAYTRAITLDPKNAIAYDSRGNVRIFKGEWDAALPDINRAIELDPKFALAYIHRGLVRQAGSDPHGALADFNRAVELAPKYAYAYYERALAKRNQDDPDGAIADLDRDIELNPKDYAAYRDRSEVKQSKGDFDGAIADLDHLVEISPGDAYALGSRGSVKQARGDLDGAIADYTRSIALFPDANICAARGFAECNKGDLDAAFADDSRAIMLDPKCAQAYFNRGFLNDIKRDWKAALEDYTHFCDLPVEGDDLTYEDYARLYIWLTRARLGDSGAADKELSAYIDKRPAASRGDWVSKVAGHLLGAVTEPELLSAAVARDEVKDSGQHCEAWFYTGMKKLLAGDKKAAAVCFHKSLATGRKDFAEYKMAQSELKALGE